MPIEINQMLAMWIYALLIINTILLGVYLYRQKRVIEVLEKMFMSFGKKIAELDEEIKRLKKK